MASTERSDFSKAWQRLQVQMAALRGDPKAEALIATKHKDLVKVFSGEGAEDAAVEHWFKRKLKGHTDSSRERQDLCERLAKKLRTYTEVWQSPDAIQRVEEALIQNTPEEGPLVCNMFAKELEGSRFEGIWISREGPGVYKLGDVRAAVQVLDGKLLVHGYFEGNQLHPVREPIKGFLAEHGPASMRSVTDAGCDLFGGGASGPTRDKSRSPPKARPLPDGWEKRESRSKPGVFYYVNQSKGLTQFDRPE